MWREGHCWVAPITQKLELLHSISALELWHTALPWLEKPVQFVQEQLSVPERRQLQPLQLSCGRRRARCPAARHTHTGNPHSAPGQLPPHRQGPNWPGTRSTACNVFPPSMTPPGRRSAPTGRARTSPLRWVQVGSRCPGLNCAGQLYARRYTAGRSPSTACPFAEHKKISDCNILSTNLHRHRKYFEFNRN